MKKAWIVLISIFIIVFTLRIYFTGSTFSSEDAYFTLREADYVKQHGWVFYNDNLSYGGRHLYFSPTFYLILGYLMRILTPFIALKVLPNLIASSVVFFVFSLTKEITHNENVSLISAFASGFMPVYIYLTTNTLNPHFFIAVLFLASMNYLIKCAKSKRHLLKLIISTTLLILMHPFSFVFLVAVWLYVMLMKLENIKVKSYIMEFIIFASFLWYSVYYLIFHDGVYNLGYRIFSMGIPLQIYSEYFRTFTLFRAFTGIGVIVVVMGLYGAYKSFIKEEKRSSYLLLVSTFIVILLFALMRVMMLTEALAYFGFLLAILTGIAFDEMLQYAKKMKHRRTALFFIAVLILVLLVTSASSSYIEAYSQYSNRIPEKKVTALSWLAGFPSATVLGNYKEGNLITYFAHKKDVMDTNFGWDVNTAERFEDIKKIYTTPFQTSALELTDKYSIRYIIFSNQTQEMFGVNSLKFRENNNCFPLIYNKGIKVYEVRCRLS